jgi:hypothetical protein
VDTSQEPREQLQHELYLTRQEFRAEYDRLLPQWKFGVGVRGRGIGIRARTRSGHITGIYILFNVVFFAAGIGFIFVKGVLQTLGIALVVGSLFSFGTFVSQFWMLETQREHDVSDRAFDEGYEDARYKEIQRLAKKEWELSKKMESFDSSQSKADDTTN